MSDRWVRASEIGEYVYCRRAWWLRRVEGWPSANVREMEAGNRYHREHGQTVQRAVWAQRLALLLLFCVIALVVFQLLSSTTTIF